MTGILQQPLILMEGAVIERLRREAAVPMDPHVLNAILLFSAEGRGVLESVYGEYLAAGREFGMPMILLTPTWRANPDRCAAAGLEFKAVQRDASAFLNALRSRQGEYARKIHIGGLMGCRGDAYNPREGIAEEEAVRFYAPQAAALAGAGVDFLIASTLPALEEAAGLGRAMGRTGLPFILSFVLRPDGMLLDGTLFKQAVARLDGLSPKPLGYMVNCTHPANLLEAMAAAGNRRAEVRARLLGLQGNTSRRSPEALDGAAELESEDPETFGIAMADAARSLRLRILGGCCGTDARHIRAIARRLSVFCYNGSASIEREDPMNPELRRMQDHHEYSELEEVLRRGDRYDIEDLVYLCRETGGETAGHLMEMLGHEDVVILAEAAYVLGEAGATEAVDKLLDLLHNTNDRVRKSGASALGRIRDLRAVEPLSGLLFDSDKRIVEAAVRALGEIGAPVPTEMLVRLLKDENVRVREGAARTAGDTGDPGVAAHLIPLLQEEDPYVQETAARSLGRLKAQEAVGPLVELLSVRNDYLREAAIGSLARIGGNRAVEALNGLLKDGDWKVREQAASAFKWMEDLHPGSEVAIRAPSEPDDIVFPEPEPEPEIPKAKKRRSASIRKRRKPAAMKRSTEKSATLMSRSRHKGIPPETKEE